MWPTFVYLGVFDPAFWLFLPAVVGVIAYDRGWYKRNREVRQDEQN